MQEEMKCRGGCVQCTPTFKSEVFCRSTHTDEMERLFSPLEISPGLRGACGARHELLGTARAHSEMADWS